MEAFDLALKAELRQTQAALDGSLPVIPWREIEPARSADALIKGVLYRNTLTAMIGNAGSGKTFFVNDLAFHVAAAIEWRGRKVKHAGVLYIALEGAAGIANRIAALKAHHNAYGNGEVAPPSFNLSVVSLDLLGDPDAAQRITKTALALGNTGLIVIDTLARSMAGGDENSSIDMGKLIQILDNIRAATGACILIVHHTGKDASKGARGHSSLRAALDTEIEVTKLNNGTRLAKITKQKDGIDGLEFAFNLHVVELGQDDDGDPITSCVCEPADTVPAQRKVTGQTKVALDLLKEAIAQGGETPPASNHIPENISACSVTLWRDYCERGQMSDPNKPDAFRMAFKRASEKLQELGIVGHWNGWVWICQ